MIGGQHIFVVAAVLALAGCVTGRQYCKRSDPCWPSDQAVNAFAKTLNGEVVRPTDFLYANATAQPKNTRFLRKPGLIVGPKSPGDIKKALAFGKKYNLQITIISSGHSFIGRSTADDSLSINFYYMQGVSVNLKDDASDTGASVTCDSAATWAQVYEEVDKVGKVVVGGAALTVAVGGYTLGGGHSPLSRMFGLAIDNVIEIRVVVPDGRILIARKDATAEIDESGRVIKIDRDGDLFWALRGGGGGTFGVAYSFTFKLHPGKAYSTFTVTYPWMTSYAGNVGQRVLQYMGGLMQVMPRSVSGYIITTNYNTDPKQTAIGNKGTITISLLNYGKADELKFWVQPLEYFMKDVQYYRSNYTEFRSFYDWKHRSTDPTGYPIYIFSTFLQDDNFNGTHAEVVNDHLFAKDALSYGGTYTLLGGRMRDFDEDSTPIAEGFRNALASVTYGVSWEKHTKAEEARHIQVSQKFAKVLTTTGRNVYFNEPDSLLADFKTAFWGPNYNRLLSIKRRYDPDLQFWCLECVGSDIDPSSKTTPPKTTKDIYKQVQKADGKDELSQLLSSPAVVSALVKERQGNMIAFAAFLKDLKPDTRTKIAEALAKSSVVG